MLNFIFKNKTDDDDDNDDDDDDDDYKVVICAVQNFQGLVLCYFLLFDLCEEIVNRDVFISSK